MTAPLTQLFELKQNFGLKWFETTSLFRQVR